MKINLDDKNWGRKLKPTTGVVYGIIARYSYSGKGWFGSYKALSDISPVILSKSTVSNAIDELLKCNLIVKKEDAYFVQNLDSNVQNLDNSVQNLDDSVQNLDENSFPPNNPLLLNNMNEEKEMKAATRMQEHDAGTRAQSSVDFSFEGFKQAFNQATGNRAEWAGRENTCYQIWNETPIVKCRYIVQRLEECKCAKTNPIFFLRDFVMPEPTSYFGKQLPRDGKYYTATYEGKLGLYSEKDVRLYSMQNPKPFNV